MSGGVVYQQTAAGDPDAILGGVAQLRLGLHRRVVARVLSGFGEEF
jgi:hypothetical protein